MTNGIESKTTAERLDLPVLTQTKRSDPATTVLNAVFADLNAPPLTLYSPHREEPQILSRDEWVSRSARLASHFRDLGMEGEDRVVFSLPTGSAFLYALMATWFNRAVSVPVAHRGTKKKPAVWRQTLGQILGSVKPRFVIGTEESLSSICDSIELPDDVHLIRDSDVLESIKVVGDPKIPQLPEPDQLAHIQFTSGSTGCPKGILVRHRQIADNLRAAGDRVRVQGDDRFLSWLPLHHDMGFIGGLLFPLYSNIAQALVPTESFMRRPQVWPALISEFRATLSPAPTFAFELLATRVSDSALQKATLDLSCWRYAWMGAEPIFSKTLDAFTSRFRRYGLLPSALAPCYGLAEATLAVTGSEPETRPRVVWIEARSLRESGRAEAARGGAPGAIPIVGVGRTLEGMDLRIVDNWDEELGERREGRILLKGPCVADRVLMPDGVRTNGAWLDTGDLGFSIGDELFITGRVKDVLIRGGVNMHPHWVERAGESVAEIRPSRSAAVSVFQHATGRQEILFLAEPARYPLADDAEVKQLIRRRVMEETGLQLDRIELVPPGAIPKTTSGKVQRGLAAKLFTSGQLTASDS